jgi:hypothetical protein
MFNTTFNNISHFKGFYLYFIILSIEMDGGGCFQGLILKFSVNTFKKKKKNILYTIHDRYINVPWVKQYILMKEILLFIGKLYI